MRESSRAVALLATATWLMLVSAATAQEPGQMASSSGQGPNNVQDADPTTEVDEIVVTGQRRTERAFDVPVQVTALNQEALADADVLTLEDLQSKTPSTYFGGAQNYGTTTIAIRGVGGSVTVFGEEPVAIFFDDQFIPRGQGAAALLDIASIEILRGPQGTLYGRNATAGAVLLRSVRPSFDGVGGMAKMRIAEFGDERYEAAVGGPLTDNLAVRLAGLYSDRDGWATNLGQPDNTDLDEFETARLRASALWMPASDVTVFGLVELAKGNSQVARARLSLDTDNAVLIPQDRLDAIRDGEFALNNPNRNEFEEARLALSLTKAFEGFDLIAEAGYIYQDTIGESDSDGLGVTLLFNAGEFETIAYTQDLRLVSSGDNRFDWVVGASLIQDRYQMPYFLIRNATTNANLGFFSLQRTKAYALYGEGSYDLTDRLTATIGLRATYETKRADVDRLFRNLSTGAVTADPPPFFGEESWQNLSPRAILRFQASESLNLYASYSQGFKGGGFNAFGVDRAYDPETITAYEAGFKARLFDRRLSINGAAFYYDYKDLQVRLGVPGGGVAIASASGAEVQGAEVDLTFRPVPSLELFANATVLDTAYQAFLTPNLRGALVNAEGNALSRAPELQYGFGFTYERPITPALTGRLTLSASYQDDVVFIPTDQSSLAWRSESYTEVDARISIGPTERDWELAAFVQNLTDEVVVTAIEAQGNFPVASFSEPRKFGIELSKQF